MEYELTICNIYICISWPIKVSTYILHELQDCLFLQGYINERNNIVECFNKSGNKHRVLNYKRQDCSIN